MVRKRHSFNERTSHRAEFGPDVSERLYVSQSDIETIGVQDIQPGSITDSAIDPGGIHGDNITPGTLPPQGPGTPPPVPKVIWVLNDAVPPVLVPAVSVTEINKDGTAITNLIVLAGYDPNPTDLTDLDHYILETTRFRIINPGQPDDGTADWARATIWTSQALTDVGEPDLTGAFDSPVVQSQVLSTTNYWLRVYAVSKSGARSDPSPEIVLFETSEDNVAPPPPTGIVVRSGMGTVSVRWDPISVTDLAYVEVEVTEQPSGSPLTVQVAGTMTVITGLLNGATYGIRLRAVDLSNNVMVTPVTDPPVVVKATDATAGWVVADDGTPTVDDAAQAIFDVADIEELFAGEINADWITSGTLKVGSGATDQADAIMVYDAAGNPIGSWGPTGIILEDPSNPGYKMYLDETSLFIKDVSTPASPINVVSITPLGIDAASVTFGSARGGHNLVPNSSFETGLFGATAVTTVTWDVAADWNAAGSRQGSDVNVTTGVSLAMTTVV